MQLLLLLVMLGLYNALKSPGVRHIRQRITKGLSKGLAADLRITRLKATYEHLNVEQKWQKYWDDNDIFRTTRRSGHKKKYVLDMFPYPSGSGLHVGHPEGYTATDIMSRYWRMNDYDVLHPMGWDSFGLPAEQHAINTGTHPAVTTYENIATFKRQLKSLGFSYDWSRELATTDDEYVRWTQWIFLQLFNKDLAMQSEVSVNWCPELGTVLANEEIIDGLSERGGFPVVRQPLRQWILKITEYADKLEEGLADMQWPEGTLSAQKQWIGRSVGASIEFEVEGSIDKDQDKKKIEVFTTRPDTIMGVTYVVVAPESPLVKGITSAEKEAAVRDYISKVAGKSDMERTATGKDKGKTGVFTGTYAVHPITGDKVPIWIADFVLASYGTGCVMCVPAHDERDFEFANKFGLQVKQVIRKESGETVLPYIEEGAVCNSGEALDGLSVAKAKAAVIRILEKRGSGREKVTYKLRDWVFSRQRYWGEPIPIYFPVEMMEAGSPVDGAKHSIDYEKPIAVDYADLPLKLPEMTDFKPGDDPAGCLARAKEWRYFQKDGKWFARETNTMPQWAGSCWYYLRFADPKNQKELFSKEASEWLPVDLYVGGQEHAVLHLLYARFWHKVLYDLGIVDHSEPFTNLVHQGMILGADGEKMSKSRGNVVNPDDVVQEHGADVLRMYEMFMGPLEATKPWQTSQLSGIVRFRDRAFSLLSETLSDDAVDGTVRTVMHKTIKGVTKDIDKMAFNTAISKLMVYTNLLKDMKGGKTPKQAVTTLAVLLSPFAPHVAEEMWEVLGHTESKGCISKQSWPEYDEQYCVEDTATVAIQVSGKVRGKLDVPKDLSQEDMVSLALEQPLVSKWVDGKPFKKVIYVPGKILNLVC